MPFCSRASLLLLPRQVPRRWAPGERLRFSFLVPTAGMEMAAWGKGRALTQGLVRGREMVYALTAVPRRGGFVTVLPQGPQVFGNPRAEARTQLLPHARCSDGLELPGANLFSDQFDEHIVFGFRLLQIKRCLGAGESPNLSTGAPQGVAPQVLVLRQRLLGTNAPLTCCLTCLPYLSAFQILHSNCGMSYWDALLG